MGERMDLAATVQAAWPRAIGQAGGTGAGSQWQMLFGPAEATIKMSPYAGTSLVNFDGPEAHRGRNLFLGRLLENLIQKTANEFLTTIVLPMTRNEEVTIVWNEWHFNETFAGRVPNEGTPRLITSRKELHVKKTIRYGIGFIMEGDFLRDVTKEGMIQYVQNIREIVRSIHNTTAVDALHEIFTASDLVKEQERLTGTLQVHLLDQVEFRSKGYASLNHPDVRFMHLMARYFKLLDTRGVQGPFVIIVSPGTISFLSDINPLNPMLTPYHYIGDDGKLEKAMGPQSVHTFANGSAIFELRNLLPENRIDPLAMLERHTLISEFYSMVFGSDRDRRLQLGYERVQDEERYENKWRDIYVYDIVADAYSKIRFAEAARNANIFGIEGNDAELNGLLGSKKWTPQDFDQRVGLNGEIDRDRAANPMLRRTAYLRLFWDGQNARKLRYWGQMERVVATIRDFENVGISLLSGINIKSASAIFEDFLDLYRSIESARYDQKFFEALIEANITRNINNVNDFLGEKLSTRSNDVIARWGYPDMTEWKGASHGGLALPFKGRDLNHVPYPPGFGSAVGWMSMAEEADRKTGWQKIGERAREHIALFRAMIRRLTGAHIESEAIDPANRLPHFHPKDSLITFFDQVLGLPRPAGFLPHLSVEMTGAGRVVGTTSGTEPSAVPDVIPWIPWPILVWGRDLVGIGAEFTNARNLLAALTALSMEGGDNANRNMLPPGLADGYIVITRRPGLAVVPRSVLYGMVFSPEGQAFRKMGFRSFGALFDLHAAIVPAALLPGPDLDKAQAIWSKLIYTINNNSTQNSRKIALGLREKLEEMTLAGILDQLPGFVEILASVPSELNASDKRQQKSNVREVIKLADAAALLPGRDDPDVDALKSDSGEPLIFDVPPVAPPENGVGLNAARDRAIVEISESRVGPIVDRINDLVTRIHTRRTIVEGAANYDPSTRVYYFPGYEVGDLEYIRGIPPAAGENFWDGLLAVNDVIIATLRDELDQAETELLTELTKLGGAQKLLPDPLGRSAGSTGTFTGMPSDGARERVRPIFSQRSLAGARWYRAPLAFTAALLESVASERQVLVLPSDPRSGHTTPYSREAVQDGNLPDAVWRHPGYASLESKIDNRDAKEHSVFRVHGEFLESDIGRSRMSSAFGHGGGPDVDMSDTSLMEDGDDQSAFVSEILGRRMQSRPIGAREEWDATYSAPPVPGIHPPQVIPPPRWTRETLERGGGGDRVRPFQGEWWAGGVEGPEPTAPTERRELDRREELSVGNVVVNFRETSRISDRLVRAMTQAFLMTRCDQVRDWVDPLDSDVLLPYNILVWRPMYQQIMASVPIVKPGLDTGATYYGTSFFDVGSDTAASMILGKYTFRSKAVIKTPKNSIIAEDVRAVHYEGGGGVSWMTEKSQLDRPATDRADLIAMIIPITENIFPSWMSPNGRPKFPDQNPIIDKPLVTCQFSSGDYYDGIWGFSDRFGKQNAYSRSWYSSTTYLPMLGSRGQQHNYNKVTHHYDIVTEGAGHRRGGTYPGAARAWNSEVPFFEDHVDPSMVRLI